MLPSFGQRPDVWSDRLASFFHSSPCRSHQALTPRALPQRQLGSTEIQVPCLCLGTMLFGESTSRATAHRLLDIAADAGITFVDSAEMYPVPQRAETQGRSEEILGQWLRTRNRSDVILATKVAGPGGMEWLRGGPVALRAADIIAAIDGSLSRLRTDYIDLYQLHWPDRYVPMFGDVEYDPTMAYSSVPLEEQLEAVASALHAGKLRYFGLSNETSWGLMKFCKLSHISKFSNEPSSLPLPRPVSIQNAYSLTCRTFDVSLAECCHAEGVSLLAYSPLAMGLLTGKYLGDNGGPPEARLNKYKGRYAEAESRYGPKPNVKEAVGAYVDLALQWGLSPASMALRFVLGHRLVASAVIGVTTEPQLAELITAALHPPLPPELRAQIDAIHARYPNPTP